MEEISERAFIDINIPRKGGFIDGDREGTSDDESSPPFYSLIEINPSGLCNRVCVFCPRVDPEIFPNTNAHLRVSLYEKIMKELREVRYQGMILFSGFGEPLLYKHVDVTLRMTKRYCPQARLEMVTNGDRVTVKKLRALFDAGLDTLLISMYDGPEQQPYFRAMAKEAGLTEEQVVLRVRWLPPEQSYGIALTNRSGTVEIGEANIHTLTEPLKRRCFYPFYMIMIDHDGAVLLCTHDWGKKLIVGNVRVKTLGEMWNSNLMKRVRLNLANADRSIPPCNVCDVDGTVMGEPHFERWLAYYEQSRKVAT